MGELLFQIANLSCFVTVARTLVHVVEPVTVIKHVTSDKIWKVTDPWKSCCWIRSKVLTITSLSSWPLNQFFCQAAEFGPAEYVSELFQSRRNCSLSNVQLEHPLWSRVSYDYHMINQIHTVANWLLSITMAARSEARNAFASSDIGIVGCTSNTTLDMSTFNLCFCCPV